MTVAKKRSRWSMHARRCGGHLRIYAHPGVHYRSGRGGSKVGSDEATLTKINRGQPMRMQ